MRKHVEAARITVQLSLFCLFPAVGICVGAPPSISQDQTAVQECSLIPFDWLQNIITLEQAEENNLILDERLGPEPVVFGFINDEWEEFKARIQDGDELWEFSSPPESWERLAGRSGLCIVRDGIIINVMITIIN